MTRTVPLTAVMNAQVATALPAIEGACVRAHVFLTRAQQLGGLALVFQWDMEEDHREDWLAALREAGVPADRTSREALLQEPWQGSLEGSLHVALVHSADERATIPSVPG